MKDTGQQSSKLTHLLCCRTLLKQYCTSSILTNQCDYVRWPAGSLKTLIYTDKRGGKKKPDHMCAWVYMCVSNEPDSLEVPRLTVTDISTEQ